MHRAWFVGLTLVTLAFAVPLIAGTPASAAVVLSPPEIKILYPLPNQVLSVVGTSLTVRVSNFTLTSDAVPCALPDHGWYIVYLDDVEAAQSADSVTYLGELPAGLTKLGVQLVCTDGSSLNPQVWNNITVASGEPQITILRKGNPVTFSTLGTRLFYSVANFTMAPGKENGPSVPGEGHVHILINGTYVTFSTANYADIGSLPQGTFTLTVELHNNDHSLVTTSTHPYGYNVTINGLGVKPSIKILSPPNNAVVSTGGLQIQVAVAGIELDAENYAGYNIPGHGHIHYYVDGVLASGGGATAATTFNLASLSAGSHLIKAELRNDDHSALTPPVFDQLSVNATGSSITIVSPKVLDVSYLGFRMVVAVQGFTLDSANYAGTNIPGHGHIHYSVDDTLASATVSTLFDFGALTSGTHVIRAELRNDDHSALSPAVFQEITVTAGPPEIKILEPLANAEASALGFRARVEVHNFTMDPQDYAGTNVPGSGHIHFYDGTTLAGTSTATTFEFGTLSVGSHTIKAELRNNDHSALSPAVAATITVTVATPSITLSVSSTTIHEGEFVVLSWTVHGFVLDSAAYGSAPELGRGHVHVLLVNGTLETLLGTTAGTTFVVNGLKLGANTIKVELYNNDHSELPTEYSDEVTVTVVAPAGAAANTVDATLFYASIIPLIVVIAILAALLMRKGRGGKPEAPPKDEL